MGRPLCERCERPLATCLCRWITPVHNALHVLLLQHPLETHQAKGSARLLALSLAHCRCEVGSAFSPEVLAGHDTPPRRPLLLYPADATGAAPAAQPPLDPARHRLVVLDATWRKSRRLLYEHPWLQALPRFSLAAPPPSRYVIRKAERPQQRSTLEATCLALGVLEDAPTRYAPLLQAFEGFVAQQQGWQHGG